MRYIAIWFGVFAAAALFAGSIVAGVAVTTYVVEHDLWWVPAGLVISLLIATLATSLEYLTDRRSPPE